MGLSGSNGSRETKESWDTARSGSGVAVGPEARDQEIGELIRRLGELLPPDQGQGQISPQLMVPRLSLPTTNPLRALEGLPAPMQWQGQGVSAQDVRFNQAGAQVLGQAPGYQQAGAQCTGQAQGYQQAVAQGPGQAQGSQQAGAQGPGQAQGSQQAGAQGPGQAQGYQQVGAQGTGQAPGYQQAGAQGTGQAPGYQQAGAQGPAQAQGYQQAGAQGTGQAPGYQQAGAQGTGQVPGCRHVGAHGTGQVQGFQQAGACGQGSFLPQFGGLGLGVSQSSPQSVNEVGVGFVPPPPAYPPPDSPRTPRVVGVELTPCTPGGTPIPPVASISEGASDFAEATKSAIGPPATRDDAPERLEKYVPPLPELQLTGVDASTIVSDWIALSTPIVSSLSPSAGNWWRAVIQEAEGAYAKWLVTSPTQRLGMEPDKEGLKYRVGKYSLLEQRVLSLLLSAIPDVVRQDVLNSRAMSCTAVMFKTLCKVQPGSALDKSTMLSYIVNPPAASNTQNALDSIRKWIRTCRRTVEIHAQLPDPSLQLAGVDKIMQGILATIPQVAFRMNIFREQKRLDYQPSQEGVNELAQLLVGELELVTLHAPDTQRPPKQPRLAKTSAEEEASLASIQQQAEQPKGKGKGKGKQGSDSPSSPASPERTKKPCFLFGQGEQGCTFGSRCRFQHDTDQAKKEGRCQVCGVKGHWSNKCPQSMPLDKDSPTSPEGKGSPKGKTKGKSKGKSNSKGVNSATTEAQGAEKGPGDAATEAMVAATKVLQNMQVAALRVVSSWPSVEPQLRHVRPELYERGLLDSGATHALRQAKKGEWEQAADVAVKLAVGKASNLRVNGYGTLITQGPTQPIMPLGLLIRVLKCRLTWEASGCHLCHPVRGRLPVFVQGGCPELPSAMILQLIEELEQEGRKQVQRQANVAALMSEAIPQGEPRKLLQQGLREGKIDRGILQAMQRLFPDMPVEVLQEVVPGSWSSKGLPINRRKRRSLQRSRHILVHLFSGEQRWPSQPSTPVLEIDITQGWDLMSSDVYGFLCQLAAQGRIAGVIGGPPCRTISHLRSEDGGPPPLRERKGQARYGIKTLSKGDAYKVHTDNVLWFRMLGLFMIANEGRELQTIMNQFMADSSCQSMLPEPRGASVFFALEHPEDPLEWLPADCGKDPNHIPSLWAFPEIQSLQDAYQLLRIHFDQGALGHEAPKPTCVLSTSWQLYRELQGQRVAPRARQALPRPAGWLERFHQSRGWARWAPGLTLGIQKAWVHFLSTNAEEQQQERSDDELRLQAIDPLWKLHFEQDHRPFRRDCVTCLEASAKGRKHHRLSHPSVFALSVDIMGPFEQGVDADHHMSTKTYALVGAYSLPVLREGELVTREHQDEPIPDDWEEALDVEPPPEGDQDPLLEPGERARHDRVKAYVEAMATPVKIKTIFLAEPVSSKQDEPIRQAIMRMVIKLRSAGCPVHRVHSDRGRQLVSSKLRTWLTEQAVAFTDTGGEDPQANGRAELSVQYCKTHVRRLLKETGLATKFWPLLLRQVSERNWRDALQSLGVPQVSLLPCGVEVRVRPRSWKAKGAWKDRMVKGRLLCPAPYTSNAYVILLPDNSLLTSSTVIMVPRQLQWVPSPTDPPPPTHRVTKKSGPRLAWMAAEYLPLARGESLEYGEATAVKEEPKKKSRGHDSSFIAVQQLESTEGAVLGQGEQHLQSGPHSGLQSGQPSGPQSGQPSGV